VSVAQDSVLSRLGPKLDECSISISNLNFSVSAGDVRELCATVGEVSRVFIHKDSGKADVTFKYKDDARRAIQRYDRVTLDNRPMRLAMKGAAAAAATPAQSARGGPFSRDHTFSNARSGTAQPDQSRRSNNSGTVFSVTMSGLGKGGKNTGNDSGNGRGSGSGSKKEVKVQAPREKKEQKERAPKVPREKTPPVDSMALDNDMDSYFAARASKE